VKVDGSTDGELKLELFNKWTCPARFTNDWEDDATLKGSDHAKIIMSSNNWWCSDGSYNVKENNEAYGTKVATAAGNNNVWGTGNGNPILTAGNAYGLYTKDRRDELLFAQCRQKRTMCGGKAHLIPEDKAVSPATDDNKRTVSNDTTNGFD